MIPLPVTALTGLLVLTSPAADALIVEPERHSIAAPDAGSAIIEPCRLTVDPNVARIPPAGVPPRLEPVELTVDAPFASIWRAGEPEKAPDGLVRTAPRRHEISTGDVD